MKKSLLFITAWLTICLPSLSPAANDTASPARHKQTHPLAQTKCTLKVQDTPAIYGFRLGMSLDQVMARFPDFPALQSIAREGATVLNLPVGSARPSLRATRSHTGLIEIEVNTPYLIERHAGRQESIMEGHLQLIVRDRRLVIIRLVDSQSEMWKNQDEFKREMSRRYRFHEEWQTRRQLAPPSPPPGVSPDFLGKVSEIDCKGFRITFDCVGPPAPQGLCNLWLKIIDKDDP